MQPGTQCTDLRLISESPWPTPIKSQRTSLMQSLAVQPPQAQSGIELSGRWTWRVGGNCPVQVDVVKAIGLGHHHPFWYYGTCFREESSSLRSSCGHPVQASRKCRLLIYPASNLIFSVTENTIVLREAVGSVVDQLSPSGRFLLYWNLRSCNS